MKFTKKQKSFLKSIGVWKRIKQCLKDVRPPLSPFAEVMVGVISYEESSDSLSNPINRSW